MIIQQGYTSKSMRPYNFCTKYNVREYDNPMQPVVVFGCYHKLDLQIIEEHKDVVVVFWMGIDTNRHATHDIFKRSNILNVTILPNIYKKLVTILDNVALLKSISDTPAQPQVLGDKVYAYVPARQKSNHKDKLIQSIKKQVPFEFVIGDRSIPMDLWHAGVADTFYSQCFIGLCLSDFAGGAGTVGQLGLRGIRAVTNVRTLPNVIHWDTSQDIIDAIMQESNNIGTINTRLATDVYDSFYHEPLAGFDLSKLTLV